MTETDYEGFDVPDPTGKKRLWGTVGALVAFIAALGLIPMALGFGAFGLRLIVSDQIPVHILNLSGADADITLSFAADAQVVAGTMDTMETLSGPFEITATHPDGTVVDQLEIDADGPVFYNVGGGKCFAVFDISTLYLGEGESESDVTVVARLYEDTRFYAFEADTILLPRRVPPDRAFGTVHWLEPVACSLLDPAEESFLVGRSLVRLGHRRDQYEEARQEAREAQGQ